MSENLFRIDEHLVPCQHIRQYAHATAYEQEEVLHLAVRQYTPLDNLNPRKGDVTIIGGHANGFPKELYEPLWDELLARSKKHGFRIRGIWIADVAQQGQSYVANENVIGNDPAWHDHPRDLLHLINMKRDQMPRPIIGIGHSMGGNHLVNLSYIHPRLLHTLILLDPVIQIDSAAPAVDRPSHAQMSTFRRDLWPSRKAAADAFKKNPFYQAWDPRVLDRWLKHGLRELPTTIYPSDAASQGTGEQPVTLTTSKHQEVFTFLRPNFDFPNYQTEPVDRRTHPDLNPALPDLYPFYRAEPPNTFLRLAELRPSALYVFGGTSDVSAPEWSKQKMDITGTGVSGSGGAKEGRVKQVVLEGYGHLIAMEAVGLCADATSEWLEGELRRFREDEEFFKKNWEGKSIIEKSTVDEKWKEMIGGPPNKPKKGSKL